MPIESDIPLEIERYQKKIVFGLTVRQLIGLVIALPLAAGAYFLCGRVLGWSMDSAGWLVMLCAMTPLAAGFIQPHGEPLERVLARKLRRALHPGLLCYTAQPEGAETATQKGGVRHDAASLVRGGENTRRYRPGSDRKRKRKQTACHIQAAKKEYRQAKARAKQAH